MMSSEIDLPADYADLLEALKSRISGARIRAQRTVNTLVIELYWSLGRDIIARQASQGWGAGSSSGWHLTWRPFPTIRACRTGTCST